MSDVADALPTGRRGQALACGVTLLASGLLWLGLAQPVIGEYRDRAARLETRAELVGRMARLVDDIPALEARLAAPADAGTEGDMLLAGDGDAVAGANLQQLVQERAARAGMTLSSVETLPVTAAGRHRRIALRVSASAPWPVLAPLLASLPRDKPRLLVDDLALHGPGALWQKESDLRATFTVEAFRVAAPAAPSQGAPSPGTASAAAPSQAAPFPAEASPSEASSTSTAASGRGAP